MLPQRMKKAVTDNPKKLATLIDIVNLPSTLREFVGRSQSSQLGCFQHVWAYIKDNKLQVESNVAFAGVGGEGLSMNLAGMSKNQLYDDSVTTATKVFLCFEERSSAI